jgi:hypothetical protein
MPFSRTDPDPAGTKIPQGQWTAWAVADATKMDTWATTINAAADSNASNFKVHSWWVKMRDLTKAVDEWWDKWAPDVASNAGKSSAWELMT